MSDAARTVATGSPVLRAGLVAAGIAVVLLSYYPLKWGVLSTAATRVSDLDVARFLAEASPSDPQTHFSHAVLLERSFVPADEEEALREYGRAVALAPENYQLWLQLGRARERAGDPGAEPALRKALELAPNYAQVRWALGNFLVRQKRFDEGFAEIRSAVAADPKFAEPAANTAWLMLGGDLRAVKSALGDSPETGLAMVGVLVRENKFDEAVAVWDSIPKTGAETLQQPAKDLAAKLASAKRFRDAARVYTTVSGQNTSLGGITNPGFESPLKLQNTGMFDWQLKPGSQSQIAPTDGQKHSGSNSLAFIFNAAPATGLPQLSQTVPVEPGRTYEVTAFYHSNLKTSAAITLSVGEPGGKALGQTQPAAQQTDWAPWNARFTVPAGVDGVEIRLSIENCAPGCTVNGALWLDDVELRPLG